MLKTTTAKTPSRPTGKGLRHKAKEKQINVPMIFVEKPSRRAELSRRITFLSGLIQGNIKPDKVERGDKGFMKDYGSLKKEQREQKLKALVSEFFDMNSEHRIRV